MRRCYETRSLKSKRTRTELFRVQFGSNIFNYDLVKDKQFVTSIRRNEGDDRHDSRDTATIINNDFNYNFRIRLVLVYGIKTKNKKNVSSLDRVYDDTNTSSHVSTFEIMMEIKNNTYLVRSCAEHERIEFFA